jgi:PAS domain S-box-containing protein
MMTAKDSTRRGLKRPELAVFVLTFTLFLLSSGVSAQQPLTQKRIVVLYWYSRDWPTNPAFEESFQAGLQSSPPGTVECYNEYLESDRFPGDAQADALHDYLRQKYARRNIDVVVAVADTPLNFLLKFRKDLFPNTPIVFTVVQAPHAKEMEPGPGLTGIVYAFNYKNTLDLALRLHPGTEQVFVISGSLENDKKWEMMAREDLRGFESRVAINYLTDLDPDELVMRVKSLPKHSIILYAWQQAYDQKAKLLESHEIFDLVTKSSAVPIYGLASWQVGKGSIGGYVRTVESSGTRAAEMALRIANGEHAQDIPVEITPTIPMFDWRELRRWGISEDSLPRGSIVKFREPSFWDQYKWYAIALVSVLIIQSGLIVGLVINRTRRKRAEEALRETQESLTIAVDASQMGTWDLDLARDFSGHRSLRHDQIFGYNEPQSVWGREVARRHIVEDDLETFDKAFARAMQTGELEFEARVRWPNGSIHWMAARGHFYFDKTGKPTRGAGVIFDITERKRAEEALRESEERFRNMADTAPVLIWVSDAENLCTYVNQQWLNFTGRIIEQELGDAWTTGIHPDDLALCERVYEEAFERRESFTLEYRLRRADGEYRVMHDSGVPRFSANGEFLGYIGSCIDITDNKSTEQALRESYNRIEDLAGRLIVAQENERKRIARDLHDDLHQQVAALAISLDVLEHQLSESDGPIRDQVVKLQDATAKLSTWIRRLSHELHSSVLQHLGLAEALKMRCSTFTQQQGIEVKLDLNGVGPLPPDVALCLDRVAQEALRNIAKHSGAKSVELSLAMNNGDIEMRIADKGKGFSIEEVRGGGLGLISMEERAKLLGGKFEVRSQPGVGTELRVSVPLGQQYGRA